MRKNTSKPRNRKERLEVQVISLESRRQMVIIKPDYVEMRKIEIESRENNNLKSFAVKNKRYIK